MTAGVGLGEAEEEVLSWLDPTGEPRVEWSRYVRRAEIANALSQDDHILRDMWPSLFEDRAWQLLGDPLMVIVASKRGMIPVASGQAEPGADSPDRVSIVAMFDANSGARQAAMPVGPEWGTDREMLDGLRAAEVELGAAARITVTPSPTRSPGPPRQPTPTATPAQPGAPLTWAIMPVALEPTFSAYPLAPGSSWTWRVTANNGQVRWAVEIVTETIEAVWVEGEGAVVRSRLDVRTLTPRRNGVDLLETRPGVRYRTVVPAPGGGASQGVDLALSDRPDSPFRPGGVHPDMSMAWMGGPDAELGMTEVSRGPETIETGADTFERCWQTSSMAGMSWGAGRWFCPGVGYVQAAIVDGALNYGSNLVADLIRWHAAELPAR